jgi:hypothetical protein
MYDMSSIYNFMRQRIDIDTGYRPLDSGYTSRVYKLRFVTRLKIRVE